MIIKTSEFNGIIFIIYNTNIYVNLYMSLTRLNAR